MKALALVLLLCIPAFAQNTTTAGDLIATCVKSNTAVKSKGKYDEKRPDDIYKSGQCSGFIEGWMEGMDRAFLVLPSGTTSKIVEVDIKWNEIPDIWKIAAAVQKDLQDVPLDSGKPADTILRKALANNDLIDFKPYELPPLNNVACAPASVSPTALEVR